ncbi:hypothetical protein C9J12_01995 [Photobacterium frigidiphilum]|uniref:DUF3955 domain-containing protein n=1 Tax=Photobacterium frigidiphilum TaxID=264736 RepID=A0A2T3JRR9_9GAMM|nr:hypothetical protein [Photobacterium frigidiphilum]PSU51738.1 hypothetical protein C9J12_01995 [Photobacterium frigidiphilum]
MNRPSFLVISFIGLISMVLLHLGEVWLDDKTLTGVSFFIEWLPLYIAWTVMMLIGLFQRTSHVNNTH